MRGHVRSRFCPCSRHAQNTALWFNAHAPTKPPAPIVETTVGGGRSHAGAAASAYSSAKVLGAVPRSHPPAPAAATAAATQDRCSGSGGWVHPPPPPLWAAIDDGEGWQRTARSRRDGARHLPRTPAPDLTRVSALTSGPPTSQPTPTMASRSARTVLNHLTIASQELSAYSAFALVGSIDSVLYQGVCEVL